MADQQHLEILKRGVDAWNNWRQKNPSTRPDLSGAELEDANYSSINFSGANLNGTIFSRTNLSRADLSGADLGGTFLALVDLSAANLRRANISGAVLNSTDLSSANLRDADLSGSDLFLAKIIEAEVTGADFTGARAGFTLFGSLDLRSVRGLDAMQHDGPSTIGIDTIYRSNGEIPESFFRGAGVPDGFIAFARSLVGKSIQFYSCFISHSTKDKEFVERLYADLWAKGVRCWCALHDLQGGRKLHEQIDEAIAKHDRLLLVLSQYSMNSKWVTTEIAKARKREIRENRRVLFPISLVDFDTLRHWECFDADTGTDSAREIREYFIPDFSNWKDHNSYQEALCRLVGNLEAVPPSASV